LLSGRACLIFRYR